MEHLLNLSEIILSPRFRQDYGDMPALCASIRSTQGLKFHHIVVEQVGKVYFLRAGGRRFKAYEMLFQGDESAWGVDSHGLPYFPTEEEKKLYSSIPCTILRDLTKADRIRIEFIENRGRKDTKWQEDAPPG